MPPNFSSTANEIWAVADLLRGDFKQSQYGRIILPFALLRRLECVLAPTKAAVLAKVPAVAAMPVEAQEKLLLREAKHFFYNTSPMDLGKLGETDIHEYFAREVTPHVPLAWIDESKRDDKDGGIGTVGYEIPFNRHFYTYNPPRQLDAIDTELATITGEIQELLQEVAGA